MRGEWVWVLGSSIPRSCSARLRAASALSGDLRSAETPYRLVDQCVLARVADELRPAGATRLLLDVRAVGLDGADADLQLLSDFPVRLTERDALEHLGLSLAQAVRPARRMCRLRREPS